MNQHYPRQDGSGGHAGACSGITRQDLTAYQELAATPRADVITPGDRGYDQAPQSWSQRC